MSHFKTDLEAIQYEHARALKAEAERDRYREALEQTRELARRVLAETKRDADGLLTATELELDLLVVAPAAEGS